MSPGICQELKRIIMAFITLIKNNIKYTYSLQFSTFLSNSFQFFSFVLTILFIFWIISIFAYNSVQILFNSFHFFLTILFNSFQLFSILFNSFHFFLQFFSILFNSFQLFPFLLTIFSISFQFFPSFRTILFIFSILSIFSYNSFQFFSILSIFSFNSFQFFPILLSIPKNCPKIEKYEKNCQKRIEELPKKLRIDEKE